jgi:hypothetical protein
MNESEKPFKKEIDYHRYWKERADKAEADGIKLKKQIEFLTLMTNEAGAKIIKLTQDVEKAKKEADRLMMNKIRFYEEELNKLRKSGL